ncbi:MAG TPA: signal recognition particle-docking protein FtsY [Candidatus Eisenbacteria bacterium]|nr:signal recognition particle-docking protein FtsY [Candidatus Eisenbacteria bacterium]
MSFLDKVTQGLQKTRDALFGRFAAVFQPGRKLEEADYEALEAALLRADVGPPTTDRILKGVKNRLADAAFSGDPREALRGEIESLLRNGGRAVAEGTVSFPRVPPATARPHVTLVVGVNGTGKTTTIAKLASRYKQSGESVLLVACDTFRAAAADQLEIWAERAGVEMVKQKPGADPAAVAFDGMARAKSRNVDRVIVDTAGRLHVKSNLMAELEKIRRVIEKALPGAPHETLLVLDATVGQNGLAQAREFDRALKLSGVALTKLDGTAKGGIVLAVADSLQMPIRWIGVGEGLDDLIPFDPAEFAAGLVGAEG